MDVVDQSERVACDDESGFMEIRLEDRVCSPGFQGCFGACCEGDASGAGVGVWCVLVKFSTPYSVEYYPQCLERIMRCID